MDQKSRNLVRVPSSASSFTLTAPQRAELLRQINGATPQAVVSRCRIVLACGDGAARADVARACGVSVQTVDRWRRRYAEEGLAGLRDRPKPGAPRRISDATIAEVLDVTRSELPPAGGSWSKRMLAQRIGVSPSTVARIWRTHGTTSHAGAQSSTPAGRDLARQESLPVTLAAIYLSGGLAAFVLQIKASDPMALQGELADLFGRDPEGPPASSDGGAGRLCAALAATIAPAPSRGSDRTPGFTAFLSGLVTTTPVDAGLHLICHTSNPAIPLALHQWQFGQPRRHVHLAPTREFWLRLLQHELTWIVLRGPRPAAPRVLNSINTALQRRRRGRGTAPLVWRLPADL